MRRYEAVFILDERKAEDGGEAFSGEVQREIEGVGGTVVKSESMGRKQFARPIGKFNAGIYWNFVFDLNPESVQEFRNAYRLNDTVIRIGIFLYDSRQEKETSSGHMATEEETEEAPAIE